MRKPITTEDLDAQKYWELGAHSVRCLQPGDRISRDGRLVTVLDVTRNRSTNAKHVSFDDGTEMAVSSPVYDDIEVTIYRPRPGF